MSAPSSEIHASHIKRAVEWKIFELQAALISADALAAHMDAGKKWFQPFHYYDVVDERVADGRCGFPLCDRELSLGDSQKLHDADDTRKYCSSACVEKSQIYAHSLDESSPLTRKCIDTLSISESESGYTDTNGVLNVLSGDQRPDTLSSSQQSPEKVHDHTPSDTSRGVTIPGARRMLNHASTKPSPVETLPSKTESKIHNRRPILPDSELWVELPSPDKASTAIGDSSAVDIAKKAHPTFLPALLRNDPVLTMPPKHIPLASQKSQKALQSQQSGKFTPRDGSSTDVPAASIQMGDGSSVATSILRASSHEQSPTHSPRNLLEKPEPKRRVKKALSFGQDSVHIFKRGAKAAEQYTESEWAAGKGRQSIYSKERKGYSSESDESSIGSPIKSIGSPNIKDSNKDHETLPTFEEQLNDWMSAGWGPKRSTKKENESQLNEGDDITYVSAINKDLPTDYDPARRVEYLDWSEPTPPCPPKPSAMSAEESARAVQEARKIRLKARGDSRRRRAAMESREKPRPRPPSVVTGRESDCDSKKTDAETSGQPETDLSVSNLGSIQDDQSLAADQRELHSHKLSVDSAENKVVMSTTETDDIYVPVELDAVKRQNFFMHMWAAMEDIFESDAISWLNEVSEVKTSPQGKQDEETMHDGVTEEKNSCSLHSLGSTHREQNTVALLQKGLCVAEKVIDLSAALNCDVAMGCYLNTKRDLISFVRTGDGHSHFNTLQWAFMGLIVMDAILRKRVFIDCDVDEALREGWQSKFENCAAHICGGASVANQLLSDREFRILRQFFDSDSTEDEYYTETAAQES